MYGQEATYKAEENIRDVVKLGLPIPFLKVQFFDSSGTCFFINFKKAKAWQNSRDSVICKKILSKTTM